MHASGRKRKREVLKLKKKKILHTVPIGACYNYLYACTVHSTRFSKEFREKVTIDNRSLYNLRYSVFFILNIRNKNYNNKKIRTMNKLNTCEMTF